MADLISILTACGTEGLPSDPDFQNVTLLLHGDGTNGAQNNTFLDSSTNNFTITRNGNTTQGTFSPFSKVDGRWGVSLDGSNDYLSVNVSGISAGTSTFTLGFWVYLRAYPASDAPFVDTRSSNGVTTTAFQFGVYSTGALKFYDGTETNLGGTVPLNTWTHIQLVRDSGNTVTPYINGTATGTTVSCTRNLSDNFFWIGCVPGPASPYLNAYISNLFWLVGSATAPASGGPTAPQSTSTTNQKLLVAYGNRFADFNTATTAKTVTVSGATVTPFSPFPTLTAYDAATNGGSGYFDGSGDYLTAANNSAFNPGTGDFTIECWFITGASISFQTIASVYGSPGAFNGWYFGLDSAGTGFRVAVFNGSSSDAVLTGGTNLNNNAWHHAAAVRTGTTFSLYVDGTRVATTTNSFNITATSDLQISGYPSTSRDWNGYISGFRIVKGSGPYDAANSSITLPTAPPTAVSNTAFLANFTNAGIIDNTMSNNLETVGNAQIDTTTKKYGTGSMEFDGTGDWLTIANTPDLQLGTGNFTVEFWVYLATGDTGSNRGLVGKGGASTGWLVSLNTTQKVVFTYASSTITSSGAITTNAWNHIAVVREGTGSNQTKIYIGGTNDGTGTVSTDFNQTEIMYVGANRTGGDPMKGFIDDLRITKGKARYTTTFTPPTAALPDIGE